MGKSLTIPTGGSPRFSGPLPLALCSDAGQAAAMRPHGGGQQTGITPREEEAVTEGLPMHRTMDIQHRCLLKVPWIAVTVLLLETHGYRSKVFMRRTTCPPKNSHRQRMVKSRPSLS